MQAHQEDLGRWRLLSLMTYTITKRHTFMRKKPIKSKKITAPGNAMIKYKCVVFFAASVAERQQKYF